MLHNEDIVEEIATGREGKIDSISSEIAQGRETPNLWRVFFSDGKVPLMKYFKKEGELRLIKCPHRGSETAIYPERPLADPL
jgi:hypothetical protein